MEIVQKYAQLRCADTLKQCVTRLARSTLRHHRCHQQQHQEHQRLGQPTCQLGLGLDIVCLQEIQRASRLTRIVAGFGLLPREGDVRLLETDAPYLTPHPFRGRRNAPAMAAHTLRRMAEVLDTDAADLAAQIAANTEAVYGAW